MTANSTLTTTAKLNVSKINRHPTAKLDGRKINQYINSNIKWQQNQPVLQHMNSKIKWLQKEAVSIVVLQLVHALLHVLMHVVGVQCIRQHSLSSRPYSAGVHAYELSIFTNNHNLYG